MDDKIALFDIDGTIADYDLQMRRDLSRLGNESLPVDLHGDIPDWLEARKNVISSQPGWWRGLPVISSGLEIMKFCRELGFGIHILTQGPKTKRAVWMEKYDWCDEHVASIAPDYGISITRGGKGLHYGRLFVDDWPPFMAAWLAHRPRGLGLMPITPENKGFSHVDRVSLKPHPLGCGRHVDHKKFVYKDKFLCHNFF